MNKIKIIKWISLPLFALGGYLGALQYWHIKWDTPNELLPKAHLQHQDMIVDDQDENQWAKNAQTHMVDLAEKLQSVSLSGAMSVDGKLVWSGAVGLASVKPKIPATVNTQYRIGSVSKAVTAVALMRMVEEGLLELDDPIHNYLPDYPKYAQPLTIRQLASHMGGVRHYQFDLTKFPPTDGLSNYHYQDAMAALTQFENDGLLFTPGQGFAYSTHGYTLLSAVMQAAGNKTFEALLQSLVTKPLGLNDIQGEHLLGPTSELASFYNAKEGLYGNTPPQNLSNKVAGGGLVSTPTDLVKLGSALLNNTLLSAESFAEMTKVQPMFDGSKNPQYYALGWRHHETSRVINDGENDETNVDVIHHGGVAVGANAFLLLVPEHNISVAIATNSKSASSRAEIQLLAYKLAGMTLSDRSVE